MLPNVLFIGPDKAGSTWIWRALGQHPEVYVLPEKDLYFFDRYYDRGIRWYETRFERATEPVRVEVCHDYLYSEDAAARIDRDLPTVRVFVCLRDPIERVISAYQNTVRNGQTTGAIDEVIHRWPQLVDRSRYGKYLAPYHERFGDRLGIFDFAVLEADPQYFLDQLCDWLGVPPVALDPTDLKPARVAQAPRFRRTAHVAMRAAQVTRRVGGESLVSRLKHSRVLDRLLYRPLPSSARSALASDDIRARLREELRGDVMQLTRLTGRPFADQWGF